MLNDNRQSKIVRSFRIDGSRIWISGHRGMVGSALLRRLEGQDCELLTVGRSSVDLRRQAETEDWLAEHRPDAIVVAAAMVGGIHANDTRPADFLYDNLMIAANVIEGARRTGVKKLLYLGSNCVYPRLAAQPVREDALLTGPLEPTNQWYAVAKIAGLKLCDAYRRQHGCDFISAMPSNLYGPNDNFDLADGHVLPSLLRRIHEAKLTNATKVVIWGSGTPQREFTHVDDLAAAAVFLLENYSAESQVNVGSGQEISIKALAELIAHVVGYNGRLTFDRSKPDGMPRKVTDVSQLHALGWRAKINLQDGIVSSYAWLLENGQDARGMQRNMAI